MNALACLAEAFTWLFRPGIRRYTLLPLALNILLFTAGSYAAWHYSTTFIDHLLPG
ncbi:EI24 domain-containing protein, partial [Cardiobacterium hominis]|uniref:EI24 domain-containing protein n=1 Tax=Cardiobacterium hominis TaxID=2718 RepID=UPI0036F2582F